MQTFGSKINFHPHVHAIVSRGGWTAAGQWVAVASVDPHVALLFRHKVLSLLRHKELIDHDRIALLLPWKHSGFSVHNSVVVQPEDSRAIERLVRYVMRSPVSLERIGFDHETGEVKLEPNPGADDGAQAGGGGRWIVERSQRDGRERADSAERKAARKRWANLIRHIYEVDPLVCPRCGGIMKTTC